jgi:hypothetical protein
VVLYRFAQESVFRDGAHPAVNWLTSSAVSGCAAAATPGEIRREIVVCPRSNSGKVPSRRTAISTPQPLGCASPSKQRGRKGG